MSWTRIDDDMLDHVKWRRAIRLGGDGVVLLWARLTTWCSRRLTDGEVPDDMVDEVGELGASKARARQLRALIDASLLAWCAPGEDTLSLRRGAAEPSPRPRRELDRLVVVGYLQRNPSAEGVLSDRDRRAQAQQKRRDAGFVTGHAETSLVAPCPTVTPSRPVPSRPVPTPFVFPERARAVQPEPGPEPVVPVPVQLPVPGPEPVVPVPVQLPVPEPEQVVPVPVQLPVPEQVVPVPVPVPAPEPAPAPVPAPVPLPWPEPVLVPVPVPVQVPVPVPVQAPPTADRSGATAPPPRWWQYPSGWAWSPETAAAAQRKGITDAELREQVQYWTIHVWGSSVSDLDGELVRSIDGIIERRAKAAARLGSIAGDPAAANPYRWAPTDEHRVFARTHRLDLPRAVAAYRAAGIPDRAPSSLHANEDFMRRLTAWAATGGTGEFVVLRPLRKTRGEPSVMHARGASCAG